MFSKIQVLLATVAAAAAAVSAAGPTINTPTALTQCQPVLLQWADSQGTTYISILPGQQTSAAPLYSFPPQAAGTTSVLWTPNLAAGTAVTFAISDSTGVKNYSGTVTIMTSSDTSCLNGTSTASASGSASGSTASASGSAPSSSSSGSSGSSSSSSGSSSSSSKPNGAANNAASIVTVGLAAVAVAAAAFA